MSVLVNSAIGTSIDFTDLTPTYYRGSKTISGLTIGHKYLVVVSYLNVSGTAEDVHNWNFPYEGFTDVEMSIRYGDGLDHNANQRAEGAILVGKATGTSATIGANYTAHDKQAIMVFDLG